MFPLELCDERERRLHGQAVGRRSVYAGRHGVEKDAGESGPKAAVAELPQRLLAPRASRGHEELACDAQLFLPAQEIGLEKESWRFRQTVQAIRVDESLAGRFRTRQQARLETGVPAKLEAVRLAREETVRAGLESKAVDLDGSQLAAQALLGLEHRDPRTRQQS